MFHVVLFEPEIPPNTGNIIRLCAATGVRLHLVKPLGFSLDDKQLKRAGLDYHELATFTLHESWNECKTYLQELNAGNMFMMTTKGVVFGVSHKFSKGDVFVFGPETRGLPEEIRNEVPEFNRIRLPMLEGRRSLNLANSVSVVVYDAWKQLNFEGGV